MEIGFLIGDFFLFIEFFEVTRGCIVIKNEFINIFMMFYMVLNKNKLKINFWKPNSHTSIFGGWQILR